MIPTERKTIQYTEQYNIGRVESWLGNTNVVTDNLHWTEDLNKVKHNIRRTIKQYQKDLEGIDLETETREYILDRKVYIDTVRIIYREVTYSEPKVLEENLGGR